MKYIKIEWIEIQNYMERPDYPINCYYDPQKNVWFIPENWIDPYCDLSEEELREEFESNWWGDIGDLEDAMG